MEIRYFLTREDIWHYNMYVFTKLRRRRLWLLLFIYAAILLVAFLNFQSLYPFSLGYFLLLIVLTLLIVFRMRRAASQGAGWGGEHIVSITPEGMQEKNEQGEGIRNWSAIKNIGQDKYSFYFIINSNASSIVLARVIPKRAFATLQDAETFLNQARQYWISQQQVSLQ